VTPGDQDVALIAHAIQLAVAPVFLLTGVGALLAVMTNRLGRSLKWLVAGPFIAAMVVLIAGLVAFLREVHLATHTLRIGPPRLRI